MSACEAVDDALMDEFCAKVRATQEHRFQAWLKEQEAEEIPGWAIALFRACHMDGATFGIELMNMLRTPRDAAV